MTRQVMVYPPYCDLCIISTSATDRAAALRTLEEIFANIRENLTRDYNDVKVIILGPAACAMPKINNRYRFRLSVKCKNNARFRELLHRAIDSVNVRGVGVTVDINPESST